MLLKEQEITIFLIDADEELLMFYQSVMEVEAPLAEVKGFEHEEELLQELQQGARPALIALSLSAKAQATGLALEKRIKAISKELVTLLHFAPGEITNVMDLNWDEVGSAEQKNLARKFVRQVKELLEREEIKATIADRDQYRPVPASIFKTGEGVSFSLYKIDAENRIELFVRMNTAFMQEHMEILRAQNIKNLYIEKIDEERYRDFLERNVGAFVEEKNRAVDEQVQALLDYAIFSIRATMNDPSPINLGRQINLADVIVRFTERWKGGPPPLLLSHKGDLYQHSLNVGVLGLGLMLEILQMRKEAKSKLQVASFDRLLDNNVESRRLMILAGILHDIGKISSGIGPEVYVVAQVNYARYVAKGLEILKGQNQLSPKLLEVVGQHAEFVDGSGFPNGIFKAKMSIFAQIISLANYYDELISMGNSPLTAIEEISRKESKFNKYLIMVLKHLFRVK